jgi:hypothetical protein
MRPLFPSCGRKEERRKKIMTDCSPIAKGKWNLSKWGLEIGKFGYSSKPSTILV